MSKYDVILDVYENQSISKAAQKHNYTQSAVSQTIRNYEKEKLVVNSIILCALPCLGIETTVIFVTSDNL